MGNPYRVDLADTDSGVVLESRALTFTESGNQPGGSQPVKSFAFAHDTAGISPTAFPITAVDEVDQSFTIAGDHRALFPAGSTFNVAGSSENDNLWTVDSVSFTGGNTVIVVTSALFGPTADGDAYNTGTTGVAVYTPVVGEWLISGQWGLFISVETGFDGNSPVAYLGVLSGGIFTSVGVSGAVDGADGLYAGTFKSPAVSSLSWPGGAIRQTGLDSLAVQVLTSDLARCNLGAATLVFEVSGVPEAL